MSRNNRLDGSTCALVDNLLARTSDHGLIRKSSVASRHRKSCLDPFKLEILEKRSKGWTY